MNKAEERYQEIIEILKENPIVTVADFAERLSVSMETIRKDLNILSEQGKIVRVHGGAAPCRKYGNGFSLSVQRRRAPQGKEEAGERGGKADTEGGYPDHREQHHNGRICKGACKSSGTAENPDDCYKFNSHSYIGGDGEAV